jgi:hypothetical protein
VLDPYETCDDGVVMMGCDSNHDGGDGVCQPPGSCSSSFVLDAGGACVPETVARHVHISISNTCVVSVDPAEVTVPAGQSASFTYHNHSVDYEATVWMSYGGGYLGLPQGALWTDPIVRCSEQFAHTAHADVSIYGLGVNDPNCPGQRMIIHCQ